MQFSKKTARKYKKLLLKESPHVCVQILTDIESFEALLLYENVITV